MKSHRTIYLLFFFIFQFILPGFFHQAWAYPVRFDDADHRPVTITQRPERVVSLVPAVTELIFALNAGNAVQGVTYHDTYPSEAGLKPCVGGFFSPSADRIQEQKPELIFLSDLHRKVVQAFKDKPVQLIRLRLDSLADLYETIQLLGRIFGKEKNAATLTDDIKASLNHTARKTASIPESERKRVIRLMGRTSMMTPGDDSFQNEFIRLAGGIPPTLGKPGKVVPITKEEWRAFNPQVIYGCGRDRETAQAFLNRPGWKDAEAVRNRRIFYFPCDLTCRLSSRTGYFVSCLSSRIYDRASEAVVPDRIKAARPVSLDLPYVTSAEIIESYVNDFIHKTLLIHLDGPMSVASTLEGFRKNIRYVGNSYSPPQCWALYHRIGLEASREQLLRCIGRNMKDTSLLFTGADMDNVSVQQQTFKEMKVYALVTAGVKSNAVRMSQDTGAYYEPGTVNMIILSNMRLTPRAMNRAIIAATEAKTAALWDMDIRSAYTPLNNPATGTGTDNIIVVEGAGVTIENAGGHSKMGELIAKAVYAGVQEAVFRQNGIIQKRNIFHRLRERRISMFGLTDKCDCGLTKGYLARGIERLLLDPGYAGFIESALAISDHYERGLVSDISGFQTWCDRISEDIAGQAIDKKQSFAFSDTLPLVLKMAFEAMLNGLVNGTEGAE